MVWNVVSGFSEDFPKEALHAISNHCFANPSGNRHSQARMIQTILASVENESLGVHLLTCAVNGSVIRGTNNPVVPGESLLGFPNHSRSAFFDPWLAGASKPAFPLSSPSSSETRGSSSACCCWVERFSSSQVPRRLTKAINDRNRWVKMQAKVPARVLRAVVGLRLRVLMLIERSQINRRLGGRSCRHCAAAIRD
jgi:hypothetical protein